MEVLYFAFCLISKLLRLRLSEPLAISNSRAKSVGRLVPVNETVPGMVSGSMALTGSVDSETGTGTVSVTCTNFNGGDGYTQNGSATIQVNNFDMVSGVPSDMSMTFSLWTVVSATSDVSFSGSIGMQSHTYQSLTINLDGRDNISKETFRFQNLVVYSAFNTLSPPLPTETYSGRIYIEKFGYVEISTASPCVYSSSDPYPISGGPIIISGSGNTRASVTPTSFGVRIEVDDNGDTVVEAVNRYFWDRLTGPSFVSLTVVPSKSAVPAGMTQHFTATGTFSDGSTRDLTNMATWISSDSTITQISSKEGTYSMCSDLGCAYAWSPGSSTITATLGDVSGSVTMAVAPAVVVSLDVHKLDSSESSGMAMAMTRQFEAIGTFSNNYRGDVTSSVTWSSSDESVATISNLAGSNGMANSVATGTTTITATTGTISGSTTLSVTAWKLQSRVTTSDLNRVVWDGSKFIAMGADGVILASSDGRIFQQSSSGTSKALYDVAKGGNTLVAVGEYGTILTSSNGTAWTPQASGSYNNLYGVVWSGGTFVALGAYGTILTSANGTTWKAQASGTPNSLHGIVWSGSRFVAVGAYGTILTSSDGTVWTAQASGTFNHLGRVAWSGSQLLAVSGAPGEFGSYEFPIHTSLDGVTWAHRAVAPAFIWQSSDVVWCGSRFFVAGADGNIFSSGDGANWTPWLVGTKYLLNAMSCSGTQYAVVAKGGMVFSYPQ